MVRNFWILIFWLIGWSAASAQVFNRQAADSLLLTLKYQPCDSCRATTLINISDFLLHLRHISKQQLDSVSKEILAKGAPFSLTKRTNLYQENKVILS